MRVVTVGTAHITPPLPNKRKPGLVPGFFVPGVLELYVRFGSAKDYLATILVADGITSSVRQNTAGYLRGWSEEPK